jgi:hypothetical protein
VDRSPWMKIKSYFLPFPYQGWLRHIPTKLSHQGQASIERSIWETYCVEVLCQGAAEKWLTCRCLELRAEQQSIHCWIKS